MFKNIKDKTFKVFKFWYCTKCYQELNLSSFFARDISYGNPNDLQKALEGTGLKIICSKCGNTSFLEKEFAVPIDNLIIKDLKIKRRKFLRNKINPSLRDGENAKGKINP